MPAVLLIVSLAVIVTKFLDCYTTRRYMPSVDRERNHLARRWMKRYSKGKVIWGGFLFGIILTVIAYVGVVWVTPKWYYQVLYLLATTVVSGLQFFVVLVNFQQKYNWFTR